MEASIKRCKRGRASGRLWKLVVRGASERDSIRQAKAASRKRCEREIAAGRLTQLVVRGASK